MKGQPSIESIDTAEGHQQFMRSEWRGLAAFAWSKYRKEGRGAIVIDLRRAAKTGAGFQIPTYYVADGSEKLAKRGGWPDAEIAEAVSDYMPEEEAVFLFLRLGDEVFHYVASDDPSPPEAFKSSG